MAAPITEFDRRVYAAVARKHGVNEVELCREFGGCLSVHHEPTEDSLFKLFRLGFINWFGNNEAPLQYEVIRPLAPELYGAEISHGAIGVPWRFP